MSAVHHETEEITERGGCWTCGHGPDAHGTFVRSSTECHASVHLSVINGHLNATPCTCRHFTRGYWRMAGVVVAVLAVVWVGLAVVAMVR